MGHSEAATLSDVELATTTNSSTSALSAKVETPPLEDTNSETLDDAASNATMDNAAATTTRQDKAEEPAEQPSWGRRFWDFYTKQEFLILVVLAIPLARLYPQLGRVLFASQIHRHVAGCFLYFLFIGSVVALGGFASGQS
jgi:hypothetical protein